MAINFTWGRVPLQPGLRLAIFVPLLLISGTIGMIFLGLATLGTSYRSSIAQTVDAQVTEIIPLCRFEVPRVNPKKSAGVHYDLPCSDTVAAAKLYDRGLILYRQTEKMVLLTLQQSPVIRTSIVVNNSEVVSLRVGDQLPVRVPVLRNSETVELLSAAPVSEKFQLAMKVGSIAYAGIWVAFLLSYRRIRKTLVDGHNSHNSKQ
jgi:hypothetical protein